MMNLKICDTHNDFLTELEAGELAGYIEACGREKVETICASYWPTKKSKEKIKNELPRRAEILRNASPSYLLHIEDLWWVQTPEDAKLLASLEPFSCSLTWNDKNSLASGSKAEGGLTEWGRFVLAQLLEAGVTVDVAHLNRESFYDVVKIVGNNIYCSHTGFYGVRRSPRNLTDKQIDIIVRSGGFVGLFFFDKCLKKSSDKSAFSIKDIVKSLRYFTSRWGYDNIGIGSDFYGIENYPEGLEGYSDFPNLYVALKEEGWSEAQIDKVIYSNFNRFKNHS